MKSEKYVNTHPFHKNTVCHRGQVTYYTVSETLLKGEFIPGGRWWWRVFQEEVYFRGEFIGDGVFGVGVGVGGGGVFHLSLIHI